MRHPLTGGGMTVALSDVGLLADMLRPLPSLSDRRATGERAADFYVRRKPVCATINTLANALYKVFCYTGEVARAGGWWMSGPDLCPPPTCACSFAAHLSKGQHVLP
jgi:2-polyprenyl-6-methoxyphenol hydroxylase-like FAD-dependent oxidoreductase